MLTDIQTNGVAFSVDREKTAEHCSMIPQCDCLMCMNFYKQIQGMYPEFDSFLDELGIDILRPDELYGIDVDNHVDYIPCYTATGSLVNIDRCEINLGDLNAIVYSGHVFNVQTDNYFVIEVKNIHLPWILDTPL